MLSLVVFTVTQQGPKLGPITINYLFISYLLHAPQYEAHGETANVLLDAGAMTKTQSSFLSIRVLDQRHTIFVSARQTTEVEEFNGLPFG